MPFGLGALLPVLDGAPGASGPVHAASIGLLAMATAGYGVRWWRERGPLDGVSALGAAVLAVLQLVHLA